MRRSMLFVVCVIVLTMSLTWAAIGLYFSISSQYIGSLESLVTHQQQTISSQQETIAYQQRSLSRYSDNDFDLKVGGTAWQLFFLVLLLVIVGVTYKASQASPGGKEIESSRASRQIHNHVTINKNTLHVHRHGGRVETYSDEKTSRKVITGGIGR